MSALLYNSGMNLSKRRPYREEARVLLARVKELERLLLALDFQSIDGGDPVVLDSAASEIASHARQVADEVDTISLPGFLIPAAQAIGDAAYMLVRAIEAGEVSAVADDDPLVRAVSAHRLESSEEQSAVVMSRVALHRDDYQAAVNYFTKAAELLREPARSTGLDVSTLDVQGGVPL